MAVTITVAELLAALRLGNSAEELAEATRLLGYASEAVAQHAPAASDIAMNESVVRLAAYIFDMPAAARGDAYANALRNSGAQRMLLPYRVHRAGYADAVEAAQAAVGSTDNPVVGLAVQVDELVVTFADGTTDTLDLPAGMGGDGTDQVARDAAGAAQAAADANAVTATTHAADANAHHTPPTGGGDPVYTHLASGHLNSIRSGFSFTSPMVVAMRAAWVISHHFEFRFKLSAAQYVTREVRTIPQPLPSTAIQVYAGIATSTTGDTKVVDFTLTATSAGVGTVFDNTWPVDATLEVFGVS